MPRALLISTYDLGHQPFGLASPAAWLREAGLEVRTADLSREKLPQDAVREATIVGFFLPMHTATRLALPVIDRVRRLNPSARLVAYGLYAPLNADLLRKRGIAHILNGEFEQALVDLATTGAAADPEHGLARLTFRRPSREGLPPLTRYAALQVGDDRRTAGYTEASRGCKHRCRHCPIVPVYDGRFRVVSADVVMEDIRAQIDAGATHITFGDPDFFNGIGHARAVLERFARECRGVSYDVTIKVEHLLKHADMLPILKDTGCAFVTSAVESVDDAVLARLEKGHTRDDFERVAALCARSGVPLSPTFVPFTPWTTIEGYVELLRTIERLDLVDNVAPVQLGIRLLVTSRSRLLELEDVQRLVRPFDPVSLTYPWTHPDALVDRLHQEVVRTVGVRINAPRREVFARVRELAHAAAQLPLPAHSPILPARATVPYLTEPWYC